MPGGLAEAQEAQAARSGFGGPSQGLGWRDAGASGGDTGGPKDVECDGRSDGLGGALGGVECCGNLGNRF